MKADGEGGDSAEPSSSLGLTISANLSGEDKITTELKRSKLAPPPPPPALLPGPKSVCSCLLCCRHSSVFSRQGNSCQFFQSLQGEDRRTSHFPARENSLCLISPSPSLPSALKGGKAAGRQTLGTEVGGDCNGTLCPTLLCWFLLCLLSFLLPRPIL